MEVIWFTTASAKRLAPQWATCYQNNRSTNSSC